MGHSEVYLGKSAAKDSKRQVFAGGATDKDMPLLNYHSAIWQRIKQNWTPPDKNLKDIEAIIQVKIGRDGKLKDIRYEKRSGNSIYDQRAWDAVKKADPFPPIPDQIKGDALEIGMRFAPS